MDNLMLALTLTVLIGVAQCTFNPYPRYREYFDDGDVGEPVYLTEYIEKGQFELAKNLSLVNHDDMKWLTSYAGYLTVNKNYNSNLFFWFFPAKLDQSKAPVVLWYEEICQKFGKPKIKIEKKMFQASRRSRCFIDVWLIYRKWTILRHFQKDTSTEKVFVAPQP